ncbi:uncharacterized protein [Rutidosis leptorrhynchoides]|uniref:uncharacterized protein n=1 Tax=Rutidosis leptorrhynchoides TaxID=125765 RepID=UPI003A996B15
MSDEGEKTCPLCAEEMDLTDQQLRPCKCGYDICVWCWHHIMDMAEKDATEGRCPACRTPYNKEKIVGTESKCERLVAEMSVEKKHKSQKGKTKTSEGRKQLSSVRVVQRNLVYIMGLPLNLADEDLLQRKEYFGQYGKVLKVSISRTAAGTIQHFANNTCSVYITYSKEDEAVRSIQSVHGFVLDGRPLRACFGTTKYCHAWLRSVPCTNPDCLYLHEFGSQEDSFTKDEIISEYTRGRVQQVTGATNEMQRRSGTMLPPAADDYSNNTTSSAKPISKSTTNDQTNGTKGSPPNSSFGRSVVLPAAASWGTRASNSQSVAASVVSSNGPSKHKVDASTSVSFSTRSVNASSLSNEIPKKHIEESQTAHQVKGTDHGKTISETPVIDNNLDAFDGGRIQQLSSHMSSVSISKNHLLQPCDDEQPIEPIPSNKPNNDSVPTIDDPVIKEQFWNEAQEVTLNEVEADLLSFNDQRLKDPEVVTHINTHTGYVHNMPQASSHINNSLSYSHSPQQQYASGNDFGNQKLDNGPHPNMAVANGHSSSLNGGSFFEGSNGHSYFSTTEGSRKQTGSFDNTVTTASNGDHRSTLDQREDSIISDVLSWDFDPWDESSTSQNLAKLKVAASRKTQSCNQSRFSFARKDDECIENRSNFTQNLSDFGSGHNHRNFNHDNYSNSNVYPVHHNNGNGFSSFIVDESDHTASNLSFMSPNKIPVSRSQISAPPGFMGPSRAPPPGFASNERTEQTYDSLSGNHMIDTSSLLRKVHQAPGPVYNGGISELEFMDPAILAVGGRLPGGVTSPGLDMRSNFPSQLPSFETDNNRLRLLLQRSFTQQNHRFSDLGDNLSFSPRTDSFGLPSRIVEPNNRSSPYQHHHQGNLGNFQQPRMSSNGHWDGWNEMQSGNEIAMAELLRNERLGFNKFYSGYEDTKFRVPGSGDLYNRTFGI